MRCGIGKNQNRFREPGWSLLDFQYTVCKPGRNVILPGTEANFSDEHNGWGGGNFALRKKEVGPLTGSFVGDEGV
jgi:hypothetical protein